MKKTLTLMLAAAATCGVYAAEPAQTVSYQNTTQCVIYPGLVEIDINGDGILDLIYSGEVRDAAVAGRIIEDANGDQIQVGNNTFQMIWNPSTNKYDISEFGHYFANKPYFAVADFNGDGLTDFYATGEASEALHYVTFGLFLNNGDGTFTRTKINVTDEFGEPITPFDPRTVDVADFNSDGLLDLVVTGWKDAADGRHNYNMVLINQGNNNFVATNTELLMWGDNGYELALNLTLATDLNNDGYADFLTQGNIDNKSDADKPVKGGKTMGRTFVAALNLGEEGLTDGLPILYDLGLAESPAHHYGHGGFEVCDFNNDGVPDIFVGGESPDDVKPSGNYQYNWQLLMGRITSDGVQYTDATGSQIFNNRDIRPLNDSKPFRAIDYNGNGMYDLFLPGYCEGEGMIDGSGNTQTGWFFPNESGSFTSYVRVPGASEIGVFFLENGVSGARNYGFFGQSWDNMFFDNDTDVITGRMMMVSNSPYETAARPDAPASATATVDGTNVKLEWTAAASAKANVTYDYYLYDLGRKVYYRGVTAFVGGDKDGVRTTMAQGRAFMAKTLNLVDLPDGDYEWGVQTVDAGYRGSKFTKGNTFRIGEGSTGIEAVRNDSPVVATEYYDLMGRRLQEAPAAGVAVEKNIHLDGSVSVSKLAF
ncbi:MAG: VCBS repeat-containing protein [Clostridium sp.]|nr:VCBS repeat-containing protein [Clostridium sp.]